MKEIFEPNVTTAFETESSVPQGEVVIGEFIRLGSMGEPIVNFSLNSNASSFSAISTISLTPRQIGRKVALMFLDGDISKPIIIGLIHSALQEIIENFELTSTSDVNALVGTEVENDVSSSETEMRVDGKKVIIEAQEEVVLKCGDASITMSKSGKISIRGKYILNRSTGVNRILGGSVQVN